MIPRDVQQAIEGALDTTIRDQRGLSGGDINDAYALSLSDGRGVFAKVNASADVTMFPAEARGLAFLAEGKALRIPNVIAVSSGIAGEPAFLVLELLEPGRRQRDFDEQLGRGLAALHKSGASAFDGRFGLDHDNFIGRLHQPGGFADDWPTFYRDFRLEPQLVMAEKKGLANAALRKQHEALYDRLDDLVGPPEPPARLHGDLWGGNLHVTADGAPALIDPAVYCGHREIDLAMMKLFGGFSSSVFDAYHEAYPLQPGHEERVPLYQLYFLMAHVNLFGSGYLGSVSRCLDRYV